MRARRAGVGSARRGAIQMTQLGRGRRDLGWGPRSGGPDSSLNRLEQLLEYRRQRLVRNSLAICTTSD